MAAGRGGWGSQPYQAPSGGGANIGNLVSQALGGGGTTNSPFVHSGTGQANLSSLYNGPQAMQAYQAQQPQVQQQPQSSPSQLTNTAQNNPALDAALEAARKRAAELAAHEGHGDPYQQESIENLRKRLSADTTNHAIDRATGAIRTQQAGAQNQLDELNARRGIGGGEGLARRGATGLAEGAERNAARAASDISLGREAQLDALTLGGNSILQAPAQYGLAQQGLTNQALGMQYGAANSLANQGLAQQNYGLNQWQAQNNAAFQQSQLQAQQQQQQWAQLMGILNLGGGYGGYGGGIPGGYPGPQQYGG